MPASEIRVLITGSRSWQDEASIYQTLKGYADQIPGSKVILVSGACPTGADALCEAAARSLGWQVERHPADWGTYGRRAGFVRNQDMVNLGADVCIGFIMDESRGATMTATIAKSAGIPTFVVRQTSN